MDKTFKKWQNDSVWWSTTCSNIILLTNLLCLWWTHMFAIYSIKTAKTKIQETKTQSTSTITDGGQVKLNAAKFILIQEEQYLKGRHLLFEIIFSIA